MTTYTLNIANISFNSSLDSRDIQKEIDNMITMFSEDRIFIAPDLDINKLLEDGLSYDEIESKINDKGFSKNRRFCSNSAQY